MTRKSYVQINGKLYEKGTEPAQGPAGPLVMGDIEPFVSPITGEVIRGRNHLRQHMKQHGVTNIADYSPATLEKLHNERVKRMTLQDSASKRDRIEALKKALEN